MKYIKIDENFDNIVSQIDSNLSSIEVRGESVRYLYQARIFIRQLLENNIGEEDIINPNKDKKEE